MKKYLIISFVSFLITSTQINTLNYNVNYIKYNNSNSNIKECEYSEEYIKWLKIPENERNDYSMPKICKTKETKRALPNYKSSLFSLTVTDSTIPSKYDLRDVNGENQVTSVKNQKSTGTCWSFAGHSSIETNILKNNKDNMTFDISQLDFSELHTAYSISQKYFLDGNNPEGFNTRVAGQGGNKYKVAAYLTKLQGPVFESDFSFNNYYDTTEDYENNPSTDNYGVKKIYLSELNKPVVADVNEIVWNYTTSKCTETVKNYIKRLVMENGSVMASYYHNSSYLNGTYYYHNGTNSTNHAISIVGWDDTISRTKFKSGNQPTVDGAFIIKNSWGNYFGDNGYFYISYGDANICNDISSFKNIDFEVEDNAYYYDKLGHESALSTNSANIAWGANKFVKKTNNKEILKEVTIGTTEATNYEIYISYEDDLSNKVLIGSGNIDHEGYGTHKFIRPIIIDKDFTIIVKYELVDTTSSYPIAIQTNASTQYANTTINYDQCFYSSDGNNWYDFKNENKTYIPSIKAYTNNIDYDFTLGEVTQNILTQDKFNIPITLTNITDLSKFSIKIYNSNNKEVTNDFNIINDGNNIEVEKKHISTINGDYKIVVTYDLITEERIIQIINSKPTIIIDSIIYEPNTVYNNEINKIYHNSGGIITIPITSYHVIDTKLNIEITNEEDEVVDYLYSGNILNNNSATLTITIPNDTIPGIYKLRIYNDEVEKILNFTIYNFVNVDDIIFKYGNKEIEQIALIKDDSIKIDGKITNNSTLKNIKWSIENPSDKEVAIITNDNLIKGVNKGNTTLIAKVGVQEFKLPITIIEKPNVIISDFQVVSNVPGNTLLDNHFGGILKTNISKQNIINSMTINNVLLTNNDEEIDNTSYQIIEENNIDKIVINSLKNSGTYKYTKLVSVGDTKETILNFTKTFKIEKYIPLTEILLKEESVNLKINETYNLKDKITYTPTNATNKNVNYSLEDNNILTIDNNGLITALKEGKVNIKIVSSYNNQIYKKITVNITKNTYLNFSDKITIVKKNNKNYLNGMKESNTYKDLIDNIDTNLSITLKESNGTEVVNNTSILKTGMKLIIGDNNYNISILGDVSGDGKINYMDYVGIYNHIYKTKHSNSNKLLLQNEYLIAANVYDKDDKINYMDYVKIYNTIKDKKGNNN